MNKEQLKKKFPTLYEIYLYAKSAVIFCKDRPRVRKFHSMSEEELKDYNASLYLKRHNEALDWNNLTTYTQKMQWAKMFDNDPRKVICADKYAVRKWVAERIGEEYLIPLLGVWDSFSEVDFSALPNRFVIKTNHGSGDAVIVRDKKNLTLARKIAMRREICFALKKDYSTSHCEMHYAYIPPKVIAEQYIDAPNGDLRDYKFLCFDGVPYFCWVDVDRFTAHKRNVYDLDWNLQSWNQREYGNADVIPKPENFDKMIDIARKLSVGFSHVRVDLYNVNGKIYFGEMTFTNGSGFEKINPESADRMLGDLWKLDMK